MADNNGIKQWLLIAAVFGPEKALTLYNIVVWGSVIAFILALAGAFA